MIVATLLGVWLLLRAPSALAHDAQETQVGRLLRFPDIHGDTVVFVYGGDLWLASATGGTARRLTAHPGLELFPKFSPDVLSDRDFNAAVDVHDFEFANVKTTRVHGVTLRADAPSPLAPGHSASAAKSFRIDLDGIGRRLFALPMAPAHVTALTASKGGRIYYSTAPISTLAGPLPGESSALHVFDWTSQKDTVVSNDVEQWTLSHDGTTLLGPQVDLTRVHLAWSPLAEWQQIFDEVWRRERDYFFDPAMDGVDWQAMRAKYAPLVPYVAHRYDLGYVLQEMIGELSNSHNYVGGDEQPDLHPANVGLLGVDFELDAARGLYRFKKIYPGDNGSARERSPLTEPGIDGKEGDYLLAIDGRPLRAPQSPYASLVGTANVPTSITVNARPTTAGARTLRIVPIADEFEVRQLDMIATNRRKTDIASGGRIGYVYIPDMEARGLEAFAKQFYPQIRKQGIILDVRYNPGGDIDQLLFERLRRVLVGMKAARYSDPITAPAIVFHGYLAAISNGYTASNGDTFSHFFKVYGLGPLIGARTWGGVRGPHDAFSLIDGGYLTCSERARYDLQRRWLIENRGVSPDIEVDNRPDDVQKGKDAQLERAIQELLKKIEARPPTFPSPPGVD